MSDTIDFWKGDFGLDYTSRNRPDWRLRVPLLTRLIEQTGARSFLDVGCNAGWNLHALRSISEEFIMSGMDVNRPALEQAQAAGFDVHEGDASHAVDVFGPQAADMVITSGVLIHIATEDLPAAMGAIRDASSHLVLAIEYESPEEREITYRGNTAKLWARPFGKLYEAMGLSLLETGEAEGYDQCRYWLLEVPQ